MCAVCNDVANGIHFGALTCEGCKVRLSDSDSLVHCVPGCKVQSLNYALRCKVIINRVKTKLLRLLLLLKYYTCFNGLLSRTAWVNWCQKGKTTTTTI